MASLSRRSFKSMVTSAGHTNTEGNFKDYFVKLLKSRKNSAAKPTSEEETQRPTVKSKSQLSVSVPSSRPRRLSPLGSRHRHHLPSARPSAVNTSVNRSGVGDTTESQTAQAHAAQSLHSEGDVCVVNVSQMEGRTLCVCYLGDQKKLAVGKSTGEVTVIKTGSHELQHTLELQSTDPGGTVTCLRKLNSIDNGLLTAYSDGVVRLWNTNESECAAVVREERQTLALAVSPLNDTFVTLGDDGGVLVYDVATFQETHKFYTSGMYNVVDGHTARSFSGCFHPTRPGELVTGGWDNTLHFWDIRSSSAGPMRHAGPAHVCGTEAIDISQDGKKVVSCSWSKTGQLQMWDYDTSKLMSTGDPDSHQSMLYAGRFLTDNLLCCGGSDPHIFRVLRYTDKSKNTTGLVKGFHSGVYSIDVGPTGTRFQPNAALNTRKNLTAFTDRNHSVPRTALCTDNTVIEIESL